MRIVALTFHDVIAKEDGQPDTGDAFYRITLADLEKLVAQLRKLGYQTISSYDFQLWQQGRKSVPERTVVLTFDDGYVSHFELVAPLLLRYRFSGTFFVTVELIGRPGYATWEQLQKMAFLGMEIGSHGLSHAPLTQLAKPQLDFELRESRRILEERLGVPIRAIAAPGGFWSPMVAEAVERAGYEAAWLSTIGTNGPQTHRLALRRVVVRPPCSIDQLVAMVEGWQPAFWWAANQQLLIRVLKRVLGVYWYEQLKRRLVPHA